MILCLVEVVKLSYNTTELVELRRFSEVNDILSLRTVGDSPWGSATNAGEFTVIPTHSSVVEGYVKSAQLLKLTISTPNFLHFLGPEIWMFSMAPSNKTVFLNSVKPTYSLLLSVGE